jgi:very-short-patch-repair endonuclease
VGLKDFLYIAEQYRSKEYYRQFGRIAQKHVDFLICERGSMGPILAIELDDSSHKRQSRSERDSFVDRVFTVAGLPVLHIPARTAYNTQALAETIQPFMKQSPPVYPG